MAVASLERSFTDYYEVLHLHPEADAAMVDQAYWHLARLYNAAIPADPSAKDKLAELNEAYSVLRSPSLRRDYDRVRELALQEGVLPSPAAPEPVPLAVMRKQRPRPRKEEDSPKSGPEPSARRRLTLRVFRIPPSQSAVSALVILVLASTALAVDAPTMLVVALLIIGLTFSTVPLVRLPSFPKPILRLPTLGPPASRSTRPTVDPLALRQSTEAMVARWRAGMPPAGEATPAASSPDASDEPPSSPPTPSASAGGEDDTYQLSA